MACNECIACVLGWVFRRGRIVDGFYTVLPYIWENSSTRAMSVRKKHLTTVLAWSIVWFIQRSPLKLAVVYVGQCTLGISSSRHTHAISPKGAAGTLTRLGGAHSSPQGKKMLWGIRSEHNRIMKNTSKHGLKTLWILHLNAQSMTLIHE